MNYKFQGYEFWKELTFTLVALPIVFILVVTNYFTIVIHSVQFKYHLSQNQIIISYNPLEFCTFAVHEGIGVINYHIYPNIRHLFLCNSSSENARGGGAPFNHTQS
jgi:hypothetical protein